MAAVLCYIIMMVDMADIELSDYEKQRFQKIEQNKQILRELGLLDNSGVSLARKIIPVAAPKPKPTKLKAEKKESAPKKEDAAPYSLDNSERRRTRSMSGVIRKKESIEEEGEGEESDTAKDTKKAAVVPRKPKEAIKNTFGEIPGVAVGTVWETRMACSKDLIHRPPVAGIHGSEEEGAYSIALSGAGNYSDDVDCGISFTYTGAGGRELNGTKSNPKNLRTANQTKDQQLTRENLALSKNFYNKQPVRVIRGYKLSKESPYAPTEGYRYDGLYTVEKYWEAAGASGFKVWKYALKRVPGQPIPWDVEESTNADSSVALTLA